MSGCYCPYCGTEYEGHPDDYCDLQSYNDITVYCSGCERSFEVDIEFEPIYYVTEPYYCRKRSGKYPDFGEIVERCKHSREKEWWQSSFDAIDPDLPDEWPCAIGGCCEGDKYEGVSVDV